MLIAMNHQEELLVADVKLSKAEKYRCPACKRPVHLKAGAVIRPHFAHFSNEACEVFAEGETEEHIEGKLQLASWLQNLGFKVEIEAYLPELRQRPDLLVTINNQKIALEFQCSSITIEKVVERTQGYLDAGYEVVWLLGEHFKYGRQLTAFQKACLTQIENQLVLFHYSVTKQRLEYRYNFHLQQNQKLKHSRRILRYGNKLVFRLENKIPRNTRINYELEHQKLLRQFQYPSEKTRTLLALLYQNKENIISMPRELYAITPSEWLLQNHPQAWKFQFVLWLEKRPLQTVITKRKLTHWLQAVAYYDIPQINNQQKLRPFYEFLEVLGQAGILNQIRTEKWALIQYPKRYKNLEEKFHS